MSFRLPLNFVYFKLLHFFNISSMLSKARMPIRNKNIDRKSIRSALGCEDVTLPGVVQ